MSRNVGAVVILALWLGAALLTTLVVAPGAFAVLPSRALAGAMVGRVLPVVFAGAIVAPALALWLSPRTRARTLPLLMAATSALAAVGALVIVNPRIAALRDAAAGPIDQLAETDPRRVLFGLLHVISVALLGIAMLAGAVLLWATARDVAPTGKS